VHVATHESKIVSTTPITLFVDSNPAFARSLPPQEIGSFERGKADDSVGLDSRLLAAETMKCRLAHLRSSVRKPQVLERLPNDEAPHFTISTFLASVLNRSPSA
jgi:hypothetical protein